MKIGNVLASVGIVLGVLGLVFVPFTWSPAHQPWIIESGSPQGSGWISFVVSGIAQGNGFAFLGAGISLYVIARLLPHKYWKKNSDG